MALVRESLSLTLLLNPHDDERVLNEIKDVLIRIMNPASHASIVPFYEGEMTEAIASVQRLKELLNRPVPD